MDVVTWFPAVLLAEGWADWFSGANAWAQVIIGIGLVIFVHELGHFLAAKACGVKCEKFYVGFDVPIKIGPITLPRSLMRFQWGETEYGIGVIPLGGYVKMLGQDDNPTRAAEESERIRQSTTTADGEESYELDPRSFPAKTVWQRMLIISAGVVMNVIFAVIFAAIAFQMGFNYVPAIIADAQPGSPAWVAGIEPGDQIIRLGADGEVNEHLRFTTDLRQAVFEQALGLEQDKVPALPIGIRRGDSEMQFQIAPQLDPAGEPHLGVIAASGNEIGYITPGYGASGAAPELKPGDRVLAVDGQRLDSSQANEEGVLLGLPLQRWIDAAYDRDVRLSVERRPEEGPAEQLEITVPPTRRRAIGAIMTMGKIVAVRHGSAAEDAGLQVGDVILAANGEPLGDPATLPQRAQRWPEEVELTVQRGTGEAAEQLQLTVARDASVVVTADFSPYASGAKPYLPGIGAAYHIEPVVAEVLPGSPAEQAGIQVGDRVTVVRLEAGGKELHEKAIEHYATGKPLYNRLLELDDFDDWNFVQSQIQHMLPEMELNLTVLRGNEQLEVKLRPVESEGFCIDRGLRFGSFQRMHYASNWSEAFTLGTTETIRRVAEVARSIGLLATGRASFGMLGGPITIARVAKSQASRGTSQLLMFLTLLSANLALLNFLPIPALDGGHMLFLILELVRGKPVDERWQQTLTMIGVLCLLGLMAAVIFNDLLR